MTHGTEHHTVVVHLLTLLITVHELFNLQMVPVQRMRVVAAITSCLLIAKIYDWLRLFNNTAFFVQLLSATIWSIRYFMLLLLVAFLMFGMPMSMLNLNRGDDDEMIVNERFEWWVVDAIYN